MRLGHDVFTTGKLNPASVESALRVLADFKRMADQYRVKKIRAVIASGDKASAQSLLPSTYSELDHAIRKGALKENTGNRYKSRITLAVRAMKG